MGTFSVGGLSTGLDTKSIVDQLISIEARPKQRLEWQHKLWNARKDTWGDLNTRLLSLQKFADGLTSTSLWTSPGATDPGGPTDAWIDEAMGKVRDFVNQYNSVLDFIDAKTGEQKVLRPSNLGEFLQGPMARDTRFSSVGFDLRMALSDAVDGLPAGARMLADIGITSSYQVGAGKGGRLEIDEAALEQALRDDYTQVQAIFQQVGTSGSGVTPDDGFARRITELVSQLRVGGKVDSAMRGATAQMSQLQDSIDRMDDRLVRKREYYDRMFASLETQIGRMNSQMGWLQGQFAQMSAGMPF